MINEKLLYSLNVCKKMPEMSLRRESRKLESRNSVFQLISQISSSSENRTQSGVRSFVAKLPTARTTTTQSYLIANRKMDSDDTSAEMKISSEHDNEYIKNDSSWKKG